MQNLENSKLVITITLTTPENIQEINKEYRNVDRATDVLSFPMFERDELEKKIQDKDFLHEDILGDIIISIEKVKEQAEEYGHSFERELSYMVVHGFYHLMGYDHMNDIEKSKRIPSSEVLTRIAMKLKLDEKEVYQLFDLAVDDNKGKVSYDIAEYIMNNDELRQCIRYVIKIKDNSIWKKMLNEINQEGQL